MSYFLWGCRRILTLITLGSERVEPWWETSHVQATLTQPNVTSSSLNSITHQGEHVTPTRLRFTWQNFDAKNLDSVMTLRWKSWTCNPSAPPFNLPIAFFQRIHNNAGEFESVRIGNWRRFKQSWKSQVWLNYLQRFPRNTARCFRLMRP